jgi:hypothetical protein
MLGYQVYCNSNFGSTSIEAGFPATGYNIEDCIIQCNIGAGDGIDCLGTTFTPPSDDGASDGLYLPGTCLFFMFTGYGLPISAPGIVAASFIG